MKITAFSNNHFELQGRITDIREYSAGKAANITVAVENGKDEDGNLRDPYYIQLKSFKPASYNECKKGMLVRVYGHIATSKYTKDGKTVYSTDMVCDYVDFLESKAIVEAREANRNYDPNF